MGRDAVNALLYRLDRYELSGTPLIRWIEGFLLVLALIAALVSPVGRWFVAPALALATMGLIALIRSRRRGDFVNFQPAPLPQISPAPLPATAKLPIFASGQFSVEGKSQRFTWLQGFFRTFATREHAVICHVAPSSFLLGEWPTNELGMWYAFFEPDTIEAIQWGTISFDDEDVLGVAVDFRVHIPKEGRFSREKNMQYRIYIGSVDRADAERILANLQYDRVKATAPAHPILNGSIKESTQKQ